MIVRETDNYIKVCMNAWLLCEACIHNEKDQESPENKLIEICTLCAQSCLMVASGMINNPNDMQKQIFDCYLLCKECHKECAKYPQTDIEYCGDICKHCSDQLRNLIAMQLN